MNFFVTCNSIPDMHIHAIAKMLLPFMVPLGSVLCLCLCCWLMMMVPVPTAAAAALSLKADATEKPDRPLEMLTLAKLPLQSQPPLLLYLRSDSAQTR